MAGFTAIAAGVGMAATAASTGMSFSQASKQRDMQEKAQKAANEAIQLAKKRLDVNYLEELSIPKEPYRLQREAALAAGAQLTEAARESERGAAAGAGRVMAATQDVQDKIASNMAMDMFNIDKAIRLEDARLRDEKVKIDKVKAEGAALAARDANEQYNKALREGFEGAMSLTQQGLDMVPLYSKNKMARSYDKLFKGVGGDIDQLKARIGMRTGNVNSLSGLSEMQLRDYVTENLTLEDLEAIIQGLNMSLDDMEKIKAVFNKPF